MKSLGSLIQSKAQQSQILRGALSAQVVEAANLVLQNFLAKKSLTRPGLFTSRDGFNHYLFKFNGRSGYPDQRRPDYQ